MKNRLLASTDQLRTMQKQLRRARQSAQHKIRTIEIIDEGSCFRARYSGSPSSVFGATPEEAAKRLRFNPQSERCKTYGKDIDFD
jgi:hypothetical protein